MATKMYTTADRMHMQVLILYHYYYSLLSQSNSQPIRASIIVQYYISRRVGKTCQQRLTWEEKEKIGKRRVQPSSQVPTKSGRNAQPATAGPLQGFHVCCCPAQSIENLWGPRPPPRPLACARGAREPATLLILLLYVRAVLWAWHFHLAGNR